MAGPRVVDPPDTRNDPPPHGRRPGRARRTLLAVAGVLVLAAAAAAAFGLATDRSGPPTSEAVPLVSVPVTRGDLVQYRVFDGRVGFGAAVPLHTAATGTVTWLAPVGRTVRRGQPILRVDEKPIVLLYGRLPMYRPLAAPLTGPDVEQLERNLRRLGYTGFTVDDTYSAGTTAAVERWQRDVGLEPTGRVEPDQVTYARRAVRIAGHTVGVGGSVPADVLTWTGTTRVVTATLDQTDSQWATRGATVSVVMPGGRVLPAVVRAIGGGPAAVGPAGGADAATGSAEDAAGSLVATMTVAKQRALRDATTDTVEVRRVTQERRDVLSVPVSALLALAEGGYGVEVVDGTTTQVVAVRTGMFADGRVEVSGPGIAAGAAVEIPQ